MAFGNKSKPTRKWNYGLREFIPGPRDRDEYGSKLTRQRFSGHDAAVFQMKLAHQFQNRLVELERTRRERMEAILIRHVPLLTSLFNSAQSAQAVLTSLRNRLSTSNSQNREILSDPVLIAEINAQKVVVAQAWQGHSDERTRAFASAAVKADLRGNDKQSEQEKSQARTVAVENGLYWATSLQVYQRVKRTGPPPRFKAWQGEEVISVQFQRKPDRTSPKVPVLDSTGNPKIHPRSKKPTMAHQAGSSLKTSEVFRPNSNCWIERTWQGVPFINPHPRHCILHFRVSSDQKGKPIFASIPMILSRPLPEEGEIKWVHISRRKIGTHYKWDVQFDVAKDAWDYHPAGDERATTGTVAVALGWRHIDGEIRVAEYVGSDGVQRSVRLYKEMVTAWDHLELLQSYRDKSFEADRAELVEWLATRPADTLPIRWRHKTQTLPTWKSADRFMWLIWWWKDHRIPGDDVIFDRLNGIIQVNPDTGKNRYSGGRRQSKHLLDWRSYSREWIKNARKDFFRQIAIGLSYQYKDVVVAEIDWNEISENPQPEDGGDWVNKKYKALSSCAQLRDELTKYMNEIVKPAQNITVTCCDCGGKMKDPQRGRWVRCETCGDGKRDRAENAAKNLLDRALGHRVRRKPARV